MTKKELRDLLQEVDASRRLGPAFSQRVQELKRQRQEARNKPVLAPPLNHRNGQSKPQPKWGDRRPRKGSS